ncbi:MAG: LLM class flavin-dependent oxidoreductase [Deltaproteobacteria bacterium]|nr:LLM class flavin-dependent oxidoreductase [Deltaproteobacteria bacterium]
MARLQVGVETGCIAPLWLERVSMRLAKLSGVDSLLLPDHYIGFVPRALWKPEYTAAAKMVPSTDAFFDPFVMMGMMAARYRRVRIGTGVTEAFRRHPATLAQAFVTVDHMTGGRAILGIGNGERENTEPYGMPFTRRVGRLEEALAIIRKLWESGGEPVSIDGPTWRLRDALFATPLYKGQAPKIWVAAHAPRMLGLTGRFADGWYPTQKMSADDYRHKLGMIRAAAAEAGRPVDRFEAALQIQIAIGPGRQKTLDRLMKVKPVAAMGLLMPGAVWKTHGLRHPLGETFEGFADIIPNAVPPAALAEAERVVTRDLVGEALFAGTVDEIVEEVKPLVAAGVRHVVMWNIGPLATGGGAGDLIRQTQLIRRLRKLQTNGAA